jgi:hypothetical protein
MMTESHQQQALMTWHQAHLKDIPEMRRLFAVPNGGFRHISTAARMRAEGVRAGVWDLCLPDGLTNLWIEMKVKSNRLTDEQADWLMTSGSDNYAVAYDWIGAALAITQHCYWYCGAMRDRVIDISNELVSLAPRRLHYIDSTETTGLREYIAYGDYGSCLPKSLEISPVRNGHTMQRIPIRRDRDGHPI